MNAATAPSGRRPRRGGLRALLARATVVAVLLLPALAVAQQLAPGRPVPGQRVSGAALFDALTHAGPPGVAEELRSIAALLDRAVAAPAGATPDTSQAANVSHAAAEAARRLTNAAARLDQADASPTLVLANMADRLDTAMGGLAASNRAPDPWPTYVLLGLSGLAAAAALAACAAALRGRRDTATPGWAAALPDRLAAELRDAGFSGQRAIAPETVQALHAALAAGGQLAGTAMEAEARLDSASRRAEAALQDAHDSGLGWQERTDSGAQRLEQQFEQAGARMVGAAAEQLAQIAARLDQAAGPIAEGSAGIEQAAFRLDQATERLDEAIPALRRLVEGTLPTAVGQIAALGTQLESQASTADAASRWLGYVAEISGRLEATGAALAGVGEALPARAERAALLVEAAAQRAAAAVVGEAERTAANWAGWAGPLMQQMNETGQHTTQSVRVLDTVMPKLEALSESLTGIARMLPTRAEQTVGLLAAAAERVASTVVAEAERGAAAWTSRAQPLLQRMEASGRQVDDGAHALESVTLRLQAVGAVLGSFGAGMPGRTEQLALLLVAAAERAIGAVTEAALRGAMQVEQAAATLDAATGAAAEGAERAAGPQEAAAGRPAHEAARATAAWQDVSGTVAGQMDAAGQQVAQAGEALAAIMARLDTAGQAFEAASTALPAHLDRAADGLLAQAGGLSATIAAGLDKATGISAGLDHATTAFVETAGGTVRLLAEIGEQLLRTGQQVEALGGRVGDGLEARIDETVAAVAQVMTLLAQDLERQAAAAAATPVGRPPETPADFSRQAPDLLAGAQATVGRLHSVASALAEACDRQAPTRRRAGGP
jgi:cell division protein ZapA (FtsZ GTPase activity inhibitor)